MREIKNKFPPQNAHQRRCVDVCIVNYRAWHATKEFFLPLPSISFPFHIVYQVIDKIQVVKNALHTQRIPLNSPSERNERKIFCIEVNARKVIK